MMPGVLLGEAMAQTAAFIGIDAADPEIPSIGQQALLTAINLIFKRPVVPGDQIILEARLVKRLGRAMKVATRASVDGVLVASGELTVAMVAADQ
jgi:3-hydroxyacyl-[acyl-carrier-protein] dehydratase